MTSILKRRPWLWALVLPTCSLLAGCPIENRGLTVTDASVEPTDGPPDGPPPDRVDAPRDAGVDGDGGACTSDLKSCVPSNPCHVGVLSCANGGAQSRSDTGALEGEGSACGDKMVCSSGKCTACDDGATCNVAGKPCRVAKIVCSTGQPVCTEIDNALAGTPCGMNMVCSNGDCMACVDGQSCSPQNRCHDGKLSCAGSMPQCNDQNTNVANRSTCGQDQVCNNGSCTACKAGATCNVANPCRTGTYACNTGAPVCLESGNASNGAMCGTGKVCKDGACADCVEGADCSPVNTCHQGKLSCAGGTPTCNDATVSGSAGAPFGTDNACNQGAC